jgi:putative Mn2+ efflux pump MntP
MVVLLVVALALGLNNFRGTSAVMTLIGLELGAKLGTAAGDHGEVVAGIALLCVAAAMAAGWL